MLGSVYRYIKYTDKLLWLLCTTSAVFGIVLIAGIDNSNFFSGNSGKRAIIVQSVSTAIGMVSAIIISKIDYRFMSKLWKLHVPIAYFLVLLTFVIGVKRGDADDRAWLVLPTGLTIQPAEILKVSFVLSFAWHLQCVKDHINNILTVALLVLHGSIPTLLVHFQGDDGTALVFLVIFASMLFCSGINWKYICAAAVAGIAALPVLWFFVMSDMQKKRVLSIFDHTLDLKTTGWQQYKGRIAIGSGRVWGNGVFAGDHIQVPEIQNDFIFAFIGQALGFVGCISVLALLLAICIKLIMVSRVANDLLGKYICVGIFAIFAAQSIINIGMCLSVLPVIGITLPFFSAGGTSIATSYFGIGLVLSVYMHNKQTWFIS